MIWLETLTTLAFVLLGVALVMGFVRLLKGPTLPDRVVALELIASLTVGLIVAYAVTSGQQAMLDVAMVLALTGFLAAIAFARYLEKRGSDD
jgi:multicomponent Na+:H+ antiporter subunit F